MKEGKRPLSIESINPDNFILESTQREITGMLQHNKIHIAAIQETHIPGDYNYKLNGYHIITSAAIHEQCAKRNQQIGIPTGGVAILIHEELEHDIVLIKRIDARIIQITLHSQNSHTPLTILCTYAQRSGKSKIEQKKHW